MIVMACLFVPPTLVPTEYFLELPLTGFWRRDPSIPFSIRAHPPPRLSSPLPPPLRMNGAATAVARPPSLHQGGRYPGEMSIATRAQSSRATLVMDESERHGVGYKIGTGIGHGNVMCPNLCGHKLMWSGIGLDGCEGCVTTDCGSSGRGWHRCRWGPH
jgi:hypothetical protein